MANCEFPSCYKLLFELPANRCIKSIYTILIPRHYLTIKSYLYYYIIIQCLFFFYFKLQQYFVNFNKKLLIYVCSLVLTTSIFRSHIQIYGVLCCFYFRKHHVLLFYFLFFFRSLGIEVEQNMTSKMSKYINKTPN